MTAMDWLQVSVGFAGGAVTASLINKAVAYWNCPIIRAPLLPNIGCYVETDRILLGNTPHKGVFLRRACLWQMADCPRPPSH